MYLNGSSIRPSFHAAYGISFAMYVATPLLRTRTLSSSPSVGITQHPALSPDDSNLTKLSDLSFSNIVFQSFE